LLREAFAADLPTLYLSEEDGFAVPIGDWFRANCGDAAEHLSAGIALYRVYEPGLVELMVEEHERMRVDHSQRLYALLMLELWWKIGGNERESAFESGSSEYLRPGVGRSENGFLVEPRGAELFRVFVDVAIEMVEGCSSATVPGRRVGDEMEGPVEPNWARVINGGRA